MGAYTLSKAHRFNGVGLPTIYVRRADGKMELIKEDTFEEFARAAGVATNATA
jgi:carboxynorspermidine decarboxylase